MSAGAPENNPLAEFARAHGLAFAERTDLPDQGSLLGEDGLEQSGAATGKLVGDEAGTLCYLTYTHRSDDSTHTYHRTAAVLRVPESIGFAPYIGSGLDGGVQTKSVSLGERGSIRAADGIDDAWLTELLSPAFADWLARSPDDFEWELAGGVLCVSREGNLNGEAELTRLCEDAAQIATTVREECLEEVDSGQAARSAAKPKKRSGTQQVVDILLSRTRFETPPTDVASSVPQFRAMVAHHPSTYFIAGLMTLGWMLAVNVIGGGIFGLLLNLPNPGRAVLIFELCLLLIIGWLTIRSQIKSSSKQLAEEGFWREFARGRGLKSEDPATFAATHAKAELPGAPVRVLSGTLGGVQGALMITGAGFKRGDSIALVAGESGPVASADFNLSAPGASAVALDSYIGRLSEQLRAKRA